MNKPYLIALDMDGTLLNDKKEVSEKTKEYLRYLESLGNYIVLASGRPPYALVKFYNSIGLHSPIICFNGALVFNPNDPDFPTYESKFKKEEVFSIYRNLGRKVIHNMLCETKNELYGNLLTEETRNFLWIENKPLIQGDMPDILHEDPLTVLIDYGDNPDFDAIKAEISKYSDLNVRFWKHSTYAEVLLRGNNKSIALKKIMNYLNIDSDHLIVFGDEENDIQMFKLTNLSVAMVNSRDDIKENASLVSVDNNNNDGVIKTLQKLLNV